MAIDESKIIELISSYEKYEAECLSSLKAVDNARAALYGTVISDLEALLPRKTIADLDVPYFSVLTGTIVEYGGRRGVLLSGGSDIVILFTFADTRIMHVDPTLVYPLNEDRIWDETGEIL